MVKLKKIRVQEPVPSNSNSEKPNIYNILKAESDGQEIRFVNVEYSPANGLHQSNDGGQTIEGFRFDVMFASGQIKPGDELSQYEWAKVYTLFKYSLLTGFKNNQCFNLK